MVRSKLEDSNAIDPKLLVRKTTPRIPYISFVSGAERRAEASSQVERIFSSLVSAVERSE